MASADEDLWADPKGEYTSVVAAGPVFALHKLAHIRHPAVPPLNQPRHVGTTGYHIRTGKHNLTIQDWEYFLDFAIGKFVTPQRNETPDTSLPQPVSHFSQRCFPIISRIAAGTAPASLPFMCVAPPSHLRSMTALLLSPAIATVPFPAPPGPLRPALTPTPLLLRHAPLQSH